MKPYLSYSSRGYRGVPNKFVLDMHKVCAFYLQKNYGEVHLLTDSFSLPYFSEIPWTSVTTELDCVPSDYPQVWSLSKLYAYLKITERGEPFVHVDNDVILWKRLPERLAQAGVFTQNPEPSGNYGCEEFLRNCPHLHIFEKFRPDVAFNFGIFGGVDLDFIRGYAQSAIAFVLDPANAFFWKEYLMHWWNKAVIAEQWFLGAYSFSKMYRVETLFEGWPSPEQASASHFTHLMGKKQCPKVRARLEWLSKRIVRAGDKLINLGFDRDEEALVA